MKNQTILLAERIVKPIDEELYKDICKSLNVHFDPNGHVNKSIRGLLGMVGQKTHKVKVRKLRKVWIEIMLQIAVHQSTSGHCNVHRSKFVTANNNDFDKLQHWGFIHKMSGGYWSLTRWGAYCLLNNVKVPMAVSYNKAYDWHFKTTCDHAVIELPSKDTSLVCYLKDVLNKSIYVGSPCVYVGDGKESLEKTYNNFFRKYGEK